MLAMGSSCRLSLRNPVTTKYSCGHHDIVCHTLRRSAGGCEEGAHHGACHGQQLHVGVWRAEGTSAAATQRGAVPVWEVGGGALIIVISSTLEGRKGYTRSFLSLLLYLLPGWWMCTAGRPPLLTGCLPVGDEYSPSRQCSKSGLPPGCSFLTCRPIQSASAPPPSSPPRLVNPHGWLSAALDWLTRSYPPHHPLNFSRVSSEERQELSSNPQFSAARNRSEPYWLINAAIGAVGPQPWGGCEG